MNKTFTSEESSAFKSIVVGKKSGNIRAEYRTGEKYQISSNHGLRLDSLFENWVKSDSVGRFYGQVIRNNKADYKVVKI